MKAPVCIALGLRIVTSHALPYLTFQPTLDSLGVDVHLLLNRHLFHADVPLNLALLDDLLVQHRCCTLREAVALQLRFLLVRSDVVSLECCLVLGNDGNVHVGTGSQIVPDTSQDGIACQLDGILLGKIGLPLRLEDTHGCQATTTHGDVGELVRAAVSVDGEEVGAGGVDASNNEVGTDVALVAEEVLLQKGHAGDNAGLTACG